MAPSSSASVVSDFPQFDVVADEAMESAAAHAHATGGDFHKKVMREWRVLDAHLPETIFVRVYETKISLLRAAIIGAPGTPYQDGLFFFDMFLPSDYPSVPPWVQYRTFRVDGDPSLYAHGTVCSLSFLSTWPDGLKWPWWDPNQSTTLQVLVSLQAQVLIDRPLYNELAAYASLDGSGRGRPYCEKKAILYNQVCLLQRPPSSFESLVATHFRERGMAIFRRASHIAAEVDVVLKRLGIRMNSLYVQLAIELANNGTPEEQLVEEFQKWENKGALRKWFIAFLDKIWVATGFKKKSAVSNHII